ncbi:hypothetical protein JRQ81_012955 [Phrynocephalus forsythii]|uniref:Transmembrane protein 267 n=1 Tax=Phrynocephalus forsythii TaxID=171643 RepID=A0A9Q0XY78_9SAUR|nr:hypothetical protein JRQ81_012955 [Phrynocephalus forsythii]
MLPAMASETEKTHALLQSFSTASVISSLGLGIFCFVADKLLQFSLIQQNDWLRALSDNAVHGVVGLWSWAIVIGLKKKSDLTEVMLAGFLSSVIDLDHFVLAGSLSLKSVHWQIGGNCVAVGTPVFESEGPFLKCKIFLYNLKLPGTKTHFLQIAPVNATSTS